MVAIRDGRNGQLGIEHRDMHDERNPVVFFPLKDGEPLDSIVDRYAKAFPKEMKHCVDAAAQERQNLLRTTGVSKGRTQRHLGSIPFVLYTVIEDADPEYWEQGGAQRFFDKYTALAVGGKNPSRGIHL